MKQVDVERLRQKLEFQRHEAQQFLRRMDQEARSLDAEAAQDSADQCVISLSKEALFERSSQRRTVLGLIEAALKRIADGSFGTCVGCGNEVQDQRLQALPWTQFCLQCQGELEEKIGASLSRSTPIRASAMSRRAG
jgi:DnaK suppressor protein